MPKLILSARPPFDFAATAGFLRFSDAEVVDTFTQNRYRRAIHFGEKLFLLTVESQSASESPENASAHSG
ncbi:MAG TPA: AlkA N-terminal domain-containing protein, partial [Pyrinomonadaceae bacterium]|nr:AlkA N-terminal domain-containing protein [Pyrinomonadaceae bacterium]